MSFLSEGTRNYTTSKANGMYGYIIKTNLVANSRLDKNTTIQAFLFVCFSKMKQ